MMAFALLDIDRVNFFLNAWADQKRRLVALKFFVSCGVKGRALRSER